MLKFTQIFLNEKKEKNRIGLALSGGAAHGFAHIGVLKALDEINFTPDLLSGASAGALVGLLYAAGLSVDDIKKIGSQLRWKDMITLRPGRHWIYSTEKVPKILKKYIGDPDWDDLRLPFYPVSFDYTTGKTLCPRDLSPIEAVNASMSIPVLFKPYPYKDTALGDGGMTEIVPSKYLKDQGARYIIGVNVISGGMRQYKEINGFLPLLGQLKQILLGHAYRPFKSIEDVYIVPDVNKFSVANLKPFDYYVDEGYKATREAIPAILKLKNRNFKLIR